MAMGVIDTNLFVGPCPFRRLSVTPEALGVLRREAGLERAVATGFRSLFHYDPLDGLEQDLAEYDSLAEWLFFYAVINPEFPQLEKQVRRCAENRRIVGLRLCPALHHYSLDNARVEHVLRLAGECGLPVNLTARLFDGRVAPAAVRQADIPPAEVQAFIDKAGAARVILSMFFFGEVLALDLSPQRHPSLYLDLGCSKPDIHSFDDLPARFPPERVFLGTGAPLYYWKGSRLAIEGARLSEAQKAAILGAAAQEAFPWR